MRKTMIVIQHQLSKLYKLLESRIVLEVTDSCWNFHMEFMDSPLPSTFPGTSSQCHQELGWHLSEACTCRFSKIITVDSWQSKNCVEKLHFFLDASLMSTCWVFQHFECTSSAHLSASVKPVVSFAPAKRNGFAVGLETPIGWPLSQISSPLCVFVDDFCLEYKGLVARVSICLYFFAWFRHFGNIVLCLTWQPFIVSALCPIAAFMQQTDGGTQNLCPTRILAGPRHALVAAFMKLIWTYKHVIKMLHAATHCL